MSDLGVIATGILIGSATGIGGAILGAWMNGRSQMAGLHLSIDAEKRRQHTAEKRRLYAGFLARLNELTTVAFIHEGATAVDEPSRQTAARELRLAQLAAVNALNELSLIAPDSVRVPSSDAYEHLEAYVKQVRSGDKDAKHDEAYVQKCLQRIYFAVRADLDDESGSPGT